MSGFKPPEHFNFSRTSEWKDWETRFSRYRLAAKLDKETGSCQISSLIYAMGQEAEVIYNKMTFTADADKNVYDKVIKKFTEYFEPKTNINYERAQFNLMKQMDGEPIESFVRRLYAQSAKCNFNKMENAEEELILSKLVVDIQDMNLSIELQRMNELTLHKCIDIARNAELVKQQNKQTTESVNYVNKSHHQKNNNNAKASQMKHCKYCNQKHKARQCPAYGKQCKNCGGRNHFAGVCKKPKDNDSNEAVNCIKSEPKEKESPNKFYIGMVKDNMKDSWSHNIKVLNQTIKFCLDTGSHVNILPHNNFRALKPKPKLMPVTNLRLFDYSNNPLSIYGKVTLKTTVNDLSFDVLYIVVKMPKAKPILAGETCEKFHLINRVCNINTSNVKNDMNSLLEKYKSVFDDSLGLLKDNVEIKLKENYNAVIVPPRRVPIKLKEKVKAELDRIEKKGIITKVTTPTEWVSSFVTVMKPNGNIRICLDPRPLNKYVMREHHPLPTMEEVASRIMGEMKTGRKMKFSKLDAKESFWQLKLSEKSSLLTTFNSEWGRYSWSRLPFGVNSSPEILQRTMEQVLEGIEGVFVVADDILICGEEGDQHYERLNKVLKAAQKSNLKFNYEKCLFDQPEVRYLGHIFTSDGVKIDPVKI